MTPAMIHRGPDDEGYLDEGSSQRQLALGMRRLSIIDLEGGHQPIFNEAGNVGALLNGEIYNFESLRKQLEDRGHSFRTRSDSEVVAHGYEEWGPDCVERFEGMFALAVWDGRRANDAGQGGTLFLARDRLGIKPLYYTANSRQQTADGRRFLFASEVRTLLASGVVPRVLSRAALESYLLFGSVSEPMTLVDGVVSLPPGHRMTVQLGSTNATFETERYWSISDTRRNSESFSTGNHGRSDRITIAHQVRELLQQSVRKHLIADVPVGVFLSGGIDSTALAALAARELAGVHTFTVAFPEKEFSEAAVARRTANTLATTHQEVMLTGDQMLARLSDAVSALDQPSMDGVNTYFVSWSARQAGLKVALSGLGGDEMFGGYDTFWRTTQFQRMARASRGILGGMRTAVSAFAGIAENAGGRLVGGDAARRLTALWESPQSFPDPFYFGRNLFTPAQVAGLLKQQTNGHGTLWRDWLEQSAMGARRLDAFAAVSCMEAESYMVNTLLRDTDSMSMAHSLEVRVPFLDHPLVEFVTQLPRDLKVRQRRPKALLVDALQDLLPPEVVNQPKRGFTFPWTTWLRGPLRKTIQDGFSEATPALRDALSSESVNDVWRSYLKGNTSWSRPWSLYVLNEWCKRHLS
jgi:asparagine synthase (glutamine-hydrolysing)